MIMLGKVLITAKSVSSSAAALQYLADAGCAVELKTPPSPVDEPWLIEQSRDVAALVFAMEPVTERLLDQASKLRIIARPGVGYDTVDIAAATRRKIPVTIAAGTTDQSVADFTMGLLLQAARGIVDAAVATQQRRWERVIGTEVWCKTLAIVGLGRIGRAVVKRARGFDMRVLAVAPRPDREFAAAHGVEFVSLEEALRQADFLSLHAPLTPETQNLINERRLRLMKPGSYLINTSRGGLVDEDALAMAISEGRLAGAAVDVLREQGPHTCSPLIGLSRVIVTPHMASFAREAIERVALSVAQNIVAVLHGERPANVVNPAIYSV
jgi:phosphoglycerate dehydrogenase-like enzyme